MERTIQSMASTLIELCGLISSSVATVDARCNAMSCVYPDLNDPSISEDADRLLQDSKVARATSIALAAASQLIATMQYPSRSVVDVSLGVSVLSNRYASKANAVKKFLLSAALGVVTASSTAEIIREAGPEVFCCFVFVDHLKMRCQGCHVNDIAGKNGMDPEKLGDPLRCHPTYSHT